MNVARDRIEERTAPTGLSPRQIWIVLGSLMLGTALSALDTTIVSTALPTIAGELHGFESYAWVGTAYILVSTISTPILGKLGDLYGRRRMILTTIFVFTLGSLLCGLARNMTELIVARGIQGLGGGGIQALTFAILGELVSPRERGRYMGLYTGIYAGSAVVGPLLGGWMIENFHWPWIFLVNLPVAAIAMTAIAKTLKLPHQRREATLDLAGGVLLAVTLGSLVVALDSGRDGWLRFQGIGLLAVAAVGLALFLLNESRVAEPLIPLWLFRNRIFTTCALMGFVAGAMSFGVQSFLPLQFQDANFVDPRNAGLYLAPLMFGVMIGSAYGGKLISKTGRYRFVPIVGLGLAVVSALILSRIASTWSFLVLVLPMLGLGIGNGGTFTTTSIATQNAIDPKVLGIGTATLVSFRSLGGSLAYAAYGGLFTATVTSKLKRGLPASALAPGTKVSSLLRSPKKIHALPLDVRDVVVHAITSGTGRIFFWAAPLIAFALILAISLPELPLRTSAGPANTIGE